jgi:hypothetical protein
MLVNLVNQLGLTKMALQRSVQLSPALREALALWAD